MFEKYPFRAGSQNDRLYQHLLMGKRLTRYEATMIFHVQNVTARISDIRKRVNQQGGNLIVAEKFDPNGQSYAEYRLTSAVRR